MPEATTVVIPPLLAVNIPERYKTKFWTYVKKGTEDECWVWEGPRFSAGYGSFHVNGKNIKAHRVSFAMKFGKVPENRFVCHHCDNPPCVNPAHLFAGTSMDNTADKVKKGRQMKGETHFSHTHRHLRPRGDTAGRTKISTEIVIQMRTRYFSGSDTQNSLAREFGLSYSASNKAIQGITWAHIPMPPQVND